VKILFKKNETAYRSQYRDFNLKQDYGNSRGCYDSRTHDQQYSGNSSYYNNNTSRYKQADKWGNKGKKGGKYANNETSFYNYTQREAPSQKLNSNKPKDIFD